MLIQLGDRRFAAEGSPADCVLAGLYQVMKDTPPDLVLSGVNRGNNAAENVLYSGTVGATMEAALQGVPAIALSQFYGPENLAIDDPFEAAREHGVDCVRRLLRKGIWDDADYRIFYIKAANVLVGVDGRAKLTDFGISRRAFQAGRGAGSPYR